MVAVGTPRYRARCMAASGPRRPGVRQALLVIPLAIATAVGAVAAAPVLDDGRTSDPPELAPSPTLAALSGATASAALPTIAPSRPATPVPSVSGSRSSRAPDPAPPGSAPPTPRPAAGAAPIAEPPRSITRPRLVPETRLLLQRRLDRLRERYGIPGISAAIVLPDGSTWMGVSGLADVGSERPVTRSTSFAIASVSKTFTAALILALAAEGRIDLDAPVRRYLPGLKKVSVKVKVRHLLDHTSGLRDYFFNATIDRSLLSRPERRWSPALSMKYVGKAYFEAGKGWHYSNTNYLVLGLLAEEVGGAPLAEQVRARFLAPLGLERTWYQPGEDALGDVAHGYRFTSPAPDAAPIDLSDGTPIVPFTSVVTAAAAAGGFASNARDLARWARALFDGDVLAPGYRAAMLDVAGTAALKSAIPYGYGVQVLDIDGRRTIGHSGRLLGFRSDIRYLPDQGVSIAVLTNQSRTDPGVIVRSLLRIALTPVDEPCRCREHR